MREEKEGLRDAITAVLDAVDGTQHGNNFSLASLIMFGPSTPCTGRSLAATWTGQPAARSGA